MVALRSFRVDSADFRSFFMFFFCCLYSEEVEVLVVFIRRRYDEIEVSRTFILGGCGGNFRVRLGRMGCARSGEG